MSVSSELVNNATHTAQMQAKTDTVTGSASATLSSTEFLNLMLKQLQYQDPMDPQDNSEFVSQQCQFSQLQTSTEMKENQTMNNSIMQTMQLIGKEVVLTDPSDATKTITGTVEEASFSKDGAGIIVNGTSYPISLVQSAKMPTTTTAAE